MLVTEHFNFHNNNNNYNIIVLRIFLQYGRFPRTQTNFGLPQFPTLCRKLPLCPLVIVIPQMNNFFSDFCHFASSANVQVISIVFFFILPH